MGLKLISLEVSPPLCKGTTLAILKQLGKMPPENDKLKRYARGWDIKSIMST